MTTQIYDSFSKTSAGRRSAGLLRKHSVIPLKQLCDAVHTEVVWTLPHLSKGGKYTAEELCGPDMWLAWFTGERRVAGMCLAHLVKVGSVPLTLHYTRSGKGKKRYFLSPEPKGPK